MKKILVIFVLIVIFTCNIYANYEENSELLESEVDVYSEEFDLSEYDTNEYNTNQEYEQPKDYKGKVIEHIEVYEDESVDATYQKVKVRIIDEGLYHNEEFEAEYLLQVLDGAKIKELRVGQTVYVMFYKDYLGAETIIVRDVYRIPYLIALLFIFITIIVLIGKKKGLKTVVSLVITFFAVFYILIPAILEGYSAIIMSVVICILISVITLFLIGGLNKKSLISIIGTIVGVVVGATLAIIFSNIAMITGLGDKEAQMLIYSAEGTAIDIYGLFFAGIIIGAVGATMDIAMTISSTMNEISIASPKITTKELVKSGLNVGKDAMGTMSNTLIFAYVGQSLMLIILLTLNNPNWVSIINSDFVSSEILRGLCGTIGMISAIPITAYVSGLFHNFSKR